MRLCFLIIIFCLSACSNQDRLDRDLSFKFSKELISHQDQIEPLIKNHLIRDNQTEPSTLFQDSWISMIKTTDSLNNDLSIEIKEHQPIASLGKGKFLTQEGKIIFPGVNAKGLELINIIGSDAEASSLIERAILLQNILNIAGNSIISFERKSSDFLEAKDDDGKTYSFTRGDFRVQLERLEEFILFELNSGNMDHIRYIDLRYKNAVAVSYNKKEKTI
tara:strand:- start:7095 stop:7754 length:660 start_codon:yes stop_codon:yes gene_type:complete